MYPYWAPMYRHTSEKQQKKELYEPCDEKKCNCPNVGDKAPDFRLEGVLCGQKTEASLSDYRGKWLILLFYPSDFTFV